MSERLLVTHPRIYLGADGSTTDALLVDDGRVRAIGEAARREGEDARSVRPDGVCLFPGLTDAHVHLWGLGMRAGTIELRDAGGPDDVYATLREHRGNTPPSGWFLGHGWDQHGWDDSAELDIAVLDTIFPNTPLAMWRVDKHAFWVNSEALRRAGIGADYTCASGGHAARDDDGTLTGLLVDDAMDPVLKAIPEPTLDEDRDTFLESARLLHSHGVTGAHAAWVSVSRVPMLEALRDADELPLRMALMLDAKDKHLDDVLDRGPFDDPDGWLSIRTVKFFADGALGSQGADVLGGYADGKTGLVLTDPDRLATRCVDISERGWQPAVHAIGDAAARNVLDAFEAMSQDARREVRPRMEHVEMVHPDDLSRFARTNTVASVQPIHLRSDAVWAPTVLSEGQLDELFPWRSLAGSTVFAGGSDYPIEDPNPWHGIATAMTRRDRRGQAFRPEESLTVEEALKAYTEGAAYAAHQEGNLGRLDTGYCADFIALDRDPFAGDADDVWDTSVLQTWVGGEQVHGGRA